MLSLLGSSTTSSEGTDSTTSRICAVDGFIDWPAGHEVVHAQGPEDPADALAVGHRHDRGARRRLGLGGDAARRPGALPDPALLLDLLGEVGDPDVAGPAGVEGRLDGGPDVVGVDVAVPQAVAAHHDDGVPEARPHLLERPHGVVGRLEEVHDLVAQVAPGPQAPRPSASACGRASAAAGTPERSPAGAGGNGRPSMTVSSGVEEQEVPRPAGVDDPGLGEDRELLGRARQRLGRGAARRLDAPRPERLRRAPPAPAPSAAARATVRIVPSTGRSTAWRAASLAADRPRARHGPSASVAPLGQDTR